MDDTDDNDNSVALRLKTHISWTHFHIQRVIIHLWPDLRRARPTAARTVFIMINYLKTDKTIEPLKYSSSNLSVICKWTGVTSAGLTPNYSRNLCFCVLWTSVSAVALNMRELWVKLTVFLSEFRREEGTEWWCWRWDGWSSGYFWTGTFGSVHQERAGSIGSKWLFYFTFTIYVSHTVSSIFKERVRERERGKEKWEKIRVEREELLIFSHSL